MSLGVVLVVLFLVVPLVELAIIVQVGDVIGLVPTIVLLIAESVLGAWLVKREGRRAWEALRQGIGFGRMPSRELADAALVLVGGTLLLTPGFLTDIVGFALVLPATRPLGRRVLSWLIARRVSAVVANSATRTRWAPRDTGGGASKVVPGEVYDERRPPYDG
ncbi:MAG: FxsA family protein [Actinomycetota bacterium]|nr:FxsA family protein [Actinomycetota bacterium]